MHFEKMDVMIRENRTGWKTLPTSRFHGNPTDRERDGSTDIDEPRTASRKVMIPLRSNDTFKSTQRKFINFV